MGSNEGEEKAEIQNEAEAAKKMQLSQVLLRWETVLCYPWTWTKEGTSQRRPLLLLSDYIRAIGQGGGSFFKDSNYILGRFVTFSEMY